jgi:hypothetical protein
MIIVIIYYFLIWHTLYQCSMQNLEILKIILFDSFAGSVRVTTRISARKPSP